MRRSPQQLRAVSLGLVAIALICLFNPVFAETTPEERARKFVETLLAGSFEALEGQYTAQMKAAMTPQQSQELLDTMRAKNGALQRIGDAWFEDHIQVYDRYRVPLFFENGELDMRLVFDEAGKVAGLFLVPHSEPPVASESPYREIEVVVGDRIKGLPGALTLPDGDGPFPAAVLVHGSGPNDRDETIGPNKPFRDIAWGLASQGIATLRYDKRSAVRPDDLRSAGEAMTVKVEVIDDAVAALGVLRDRREIDADAVFIIGHSLGGSLAPRIAAIAPHPAGVVILAGATLPLPDKMLQQTRYIAELDGKVTKEEQERLDDVEKSVKVIRDGLAGKSIPKGFHLGAPLAYYQDLARHDAPKELAALGLPCLILQGGRDYQVTLDDFARWREALSNDGNACLRVFNDLDHLFRSGTGQSSPQDYDVAKPVSPQVIDCIANWINTRDCCSK